ncbi:DUF1345 domain-containing protein [Sphingomonas sp.]|jgi:uncharacterized membrane protein|uniref:DUF1345 domain-containing protein n=1 Tax=Sphingomonas sp. TaxID=28214 RepID=UPI002EDAC3A0
MREEPSTLAGMGHRIAPPRFVLFAILFATGLCAAIPTFGAGRGTMAAFDIAATVFLIAAATLLRRGEADQMRRASQANDANRAILLAFSAVTLTVILVAVAGEFQGSNDTAAVALVVATLVLAWLFSNTIYALHYAHLYYLPDAEGGDSAGIDFPRCTQPDYWDFLYFSYTLGMTFQTSDNDITARHIRKVAIGHCLAAFVFNLGVVAFTINALGG